MIFDYLQAFLIYGLHAISVILILFVMCACAQDANDNRKRRKK